jgi:hypothetical protein
MKEAEAMCDDVLPQRHDPVMPSLNSEMSWEFGLPVNSGMLFRLKCVLFCHSLIPTSLTYTFTAGLVTLAYVCAYGIPAADSRAGCRAAETATGCRLRNAEYDV